LVSYDTNDTSMRKVNMNIRGIDENLKRKFKALCAERGKTLTEEIIRLMKEELVKEGKIEV